jgi:hypothetical protein
VVALQAGDALPERRGPCFFDPRHGPSVRALQWAPHSGVERTVAVCAADARRLEDGEAPEVRMVRVGDRWVHAHEAGGIAAAVERHRTMRDERSTSHNRKNLAEAYLDQTLNGVNGPGAPLG